MEATQEPTSPSLDACLGPIGLFLMKTVIVSAAIVLSAWILLDVLDGVATGECSSWSKRFGPQRHLAGGSSGPSSRESWTSSPMGGRIFRRRRKRRSSRRSKRSRTGGGRSCRKPPRPSRAMRTSHRSDEARARHHTSGANFGIKGTLALRSAGFGSEGPKVTSGRNGRTSNPSPGASAAIPFVRDDIDASGQNAAARVHQHAAEKFALLPGLDQRPGYPDERRWRPVRIDVVHVLGAQDLCGTGLRRTALLREC